MKAIDLPDWHMLESRNVARIRYDTPKGEMWVQFQSSPTIYVYKATYSLFEGMRDAPSAGRFHQANVKGLEFTKIDPEADVDEPTDVRAPAAKPADPAAWMINRCLEVADRLSDGAITDEQARAQFAEVIATGLEWFKETV